MGLPTFPSYYSHIASASRSVLPEASGRFLLHELDSIPSLFIAVGSSGYGGLSLHGHSRWLLLTHKSMRGLMENISMSALISALTDGDFPPIRLKKLII